MVEANLHQVPSLYPHQPSRIKGKNVVSGRLRRLDGRKRTSQGVSLDVFVACVSVAIPRRIDGTALRAA